MACSVYVMCVLVLRARQYNRTGCVLCSRAHTVRSGGKSITVMRVRGGTWRSAGN